MIADLIIEVRGQKFEVKLVVSPEATEAQFSTMVNGRGVYDATWKGLRSKLMAETKKTKKVIAVRFFDAERMQGGTIVGLHSGNGNRMVQWDDGANEQMVSWRHQAYLRDLTPAEADEYRRLTGAAKSARKALDDWVRNRQFNLNEAVESALRDEP